MVTPKDIFISFASDDMKVAEDICFLLDKHNATASDIDKVSYFMYRESIAFAEDFVNKIAKVLLHTKTVLFLASKSSYESKWCNRELFYAVENNIPISTYIIDDEPIKENISFLLGPARRHTKKEIKIEDMLSELLSTLKERTISIKSYSSNEQTSRNNDIEIYNELSGNTKEIYKSALNGNHLAHLEFAKCLYDGKGVRRSISLAKEWFRKAAIMGQAEAEYMMSLYARYGLAGEIVDFNEAFIWCMKAAEQGFEDAIYQTGMDYFHGNGVTQNYEMAVYWWNKASSNNIYAKYNLGVCYERGLGVKTDYKKAFEYYKLTADKGDADAQENLAIFYESGLGTNQNYTLAFKYFSLAAAQGKQNSIYNLGVFYYNGYGVKKDNNLAFKYYETAAKMEVPSALYNLANMYYAGEGTSADIINAMIYYEKAAQKGHKKAEAICQMFKAILLNGPNKQ